MEESPALRETFICSMCAKSFGNPKKLICGYEQPRLPKSPVAYPHTSADQNAELALTSTSTLKLTSQLATNEDINTYFPLQSSIIDFAALVPSESSDYGRWNFECADTNSTYMRDPAAQTVSQYMSPSPRLPYSEPSSFMDSSNIEIVDALLFDHITPKAPRAFWPRAVRDHQFSLNRSYVLCTLRSYPHMILSTQNLPPFIHLQCLIDIPRDDGVIHKSLPGSLATCAAITQMWSVKNESNAVFIWKAIRMEQERLSAEVRISIELDFLEWQ
ncbi:MAG: hypothetical protein M1818_003585 [Claussenomyces sp. TS43310]|nr:MAG: hypothetical protein M1818_003585 [Claussenomyces sp. TS43310]